ncbi:iron-containing alcohol dehydrogenase [Anaerosphaera multitolerans]|uniref:Iron-containing alcohol dehydrogenase n=1 Tax=Anaerosphaera multitolerans TaxID=2487351 RepID=A0A437S7Q1_9FIRM|nr:iron-containing alcohol dehydrogenase [Anaerosphaera multitolerans]RVU55105.1 iron-containing alcohol dehydrogenase [Anaerosphaera multitolerans]
MKDFIFEVGTKILFGEDQLKHLPKEIKKYGNSVLFCYGGGSIKKLGLYDDVVKLLEENGIAYSELSGIEPNPRVESAIDGIRIARENKVDLVLAVGGGSVIDCAKLIAAGYYVDENPWDIVVGKVKVEKALPLGTILTLAATGSEMDTDSVITNLETKQKLGWGSKHVLPKFSIMNPVYTYSVNKHHTAAGVADIMSHTMENYFSLNDGCYLVDRLAEGILKTCIKYGPVALESPEDFDARANIMWANSWAINGLLKTGKDTSWSVHAIEHELSAFYDITHGTGLAILTPNWLRHVLNEHTANKIAIFGKNVFGIEPSGDKFADANKAIDALREFFDKMGIPKGLRDLGIGEEHLEEMAELTIKHKGGPIDGFITIDVEDVLEIYKMSL